VITAVVPVSPIPSHPDTSILEETVASIRHHLPDSDLFLTFDGVRAEQEDRTKAYEEHIRKILWKAKSWGAVVPFVFDEHLHQTGMLRRVLDEIRTPLLLFVEQDTPLVTDEPIEWDELTTFIQQGHSNVMRLYHEAVIPDEHQHMMHGLNGFGVRTSQWSQRPHVSSVAFYRRIMDTCFSAEAKCFIEDKMHGVVANAFLQDGMYGWDQYKVHIYNPGENMKRSYHLDGRSGEPKWDDKQVF
jgi:hypothetical protein